MKIVGCDLHTRYQQIAMLDAKTGELVERWRVANILTRVVLKYRQRKNWGCPRACPELVEGSRAFRDLGFPVVSIFGF